MTRGAVLVETHEAYLEHNPGRSHPERPARLHAVLAGAREGAGVDALEWAAPRAATRQELERVHSSAYLDAIEQFSASGGGRIDADTAASEGTWRAAVLAAGAGLDAIGRLDRGEADAAFIAVRPPGHHARPSRAMGFCFINNVAVTASALTARGERVLVVDWDAHHGNGTQEIFYEDPGVAYVSMHEYPLYPGTGWLDESGTGAGAGLTVNFPFPAGTTGDVYLTAFEEVVAPLAETFEPTWVIASAGFDGHRCDPLTGLGLSSGDFADLADRVMGLVRPGHRIAILEGGYDLDALAASAGACVASLAGLRFRPEAATSGGPGHSIVNSVRLIRERLEDGA